MIKSVFGVGINDSPYKVRTIKEGVSITCKFYARWHDMMRRAYSENFHAKNPQYIGVTVCKEWHSFMNFREWMRKQDWVGKHLDKDLINIGNKEYCPEFCSFVDQKTNNILGISRINRGEFPLGVDYVKRDKKFRAGGKLNGKRVCLGYFNDAFIAHKAWQEFKIKAIKQEIFRINNKKIIKSLLMVIEKIRIDIKEGKETITYENFYSDCA